MGLMTADTSVLVGGYTTDCSDAVRCSHRGRSNRIQIKPGDRVRAIALAPTFHCTYCHHCWFDTPHRQSIATANKNHATTIARVPPWHAPRMENRHQHKIGFEGRSPRRGAAGGYGKPPAKKTPATTIEGRGKPFPHQKATEGCGKPFPQAQGCGKPSQLKGVGSHPHETEGLSQINETQSRAWVGYGTIRS
jgi:hypothetical protein